MVPPWPFQITIGARRLQLKSEGSPAARTVAQTSSERAVGDRSPRSAPRSPRSTSPRSIRPMTGERFDVDGLAAVRWGSGAPRYVLLHAGVADSRVVGGGGARARRAVGRLRPARVRRDAAGAGRVPPPRRPAGRARRGRGRRAGVAGRQLDGRRAGHRRGARGAGAVRGAGPDRPGREQRRRRLGRAAADGRRGRDGGRVEGGGRRPRRAAGARRLALARRPRARAAASAAPRASSRST